MTWTNALGWAGSALLVFSLMQARVLRFRVLNLVACVILIVFNLILEIWPMVAMNVVLSAINVWFIAKLLGEQHDEAAFEVLAVGFDDAYLGHVLRVHAEDIASHQPDFSAPASNSHSYLVQRADETVGVVVLHIEGTTASVDLDYVTPRYRDFTPGEFVWRQSRLLRDLGVAKIRTSSEMVGAYYDRLGFTLVEGAYELTLA
jgi:hypothetical protein